MVYNLQTEYQLSDAETTVVNLLSQKPHTIEQLIDLANMSKSSIYNMFKLFDKKGIPVEKWSKRGKELFYFIENPLGIKEQFRYKEPQPENVNSQLFDAVSETSRIIQSYDMNPLNINGHTVSFPANETHAVVWGGDLHLGHTHTNYPLVKYLFETVRETPNLHMALLGDTIDNSQNAFSPQGTHNIVDKSGQLRLVESLLYKLEDKIIYMIEGNHEMRSYLTDHFRITDFIAGVHKSKYGGYGRPFHIVHGKRVYKVFCRHKCKGQSQYNPLHGCIRAILFEYSELARDADIVVSAHRHESAVATYYVGGQERILMAIGNAVNRDDFAERAGFLSGIDDFPVTIFHPGGHTSVYLHFNHGLAMLRRATND